MAFFRQFKQGQDLGRGQTLEIATRVTLLEDNPERYERASLHALVSQPSTIEEWLLLSEDYLVYRTGTAVLEHLRRVLMRGARRLAPEVAGDLFEALSDQLDGEETSIWLPLKGARAKPWAFIGQAPALLGSKPVPFHYYEIQVATQALYFLQQPVGNKKAKRDFDRLSQALRGASPGG